MMLTFVRLPLCSKLCWNNPPRPFLSTPAEAVEAIQGVMPPVVFKGCSWILLSRYQVSAMLYMLCAVMMPTSNHGQWNRSARPGDHRIMFAL